MQGEKRSFDWKPSDIYGRPVRASVDARLWNPENYFFRASSPSRPTIAGEWIVPLPPLSTLGRCIIPQASKRTRKCVAVVTSQPGRPLRGLDCRKTVRKVCPPFQCISTCSTWLANSSVTPSMIPGPLGSPSTMELKEVMVTAAFAELTVKGR